MEIEIFKAGSRKDIEKVKIIPNARNFATVDYSLVNLLEPETCDQIMDIPPNHGGRERTLCVAPSMVRGKACNVTDNNFTEL